MTLRETITSFVAGVFMLLPGMAGQVWAEPAKAPVVVELFTSQGCSSCPAADAFLHKLAKRDDVIALALHVDYWDYIGWKDSFATPEYTARQRAYAKHAQRRMIYTPQMVINGVDDVVGNRPMDVTDVIARHHAVAPAVALRVVRAGDGILIEAEALTPIDAPLSVQVMRYRPASTVDIKRGENAGRRLDYANVVTHMERLGRWDAAEPLRLSVPVQGNEPVVVLVQQAGGAGRIEAATVLK